MSEDEERKRQGKKDNDVIAFHNAANFLVPTVLTILITVSGWVWTGYNAAKDKGAAEQVVKQQTIKIAKLETANEGLEKRLDNHDIILGKFEVQLLRIEKTGDETNRLLLEFIRHR